MEFESDLIVDGTTELTPDQEYELWCHYWDMQREQLLSAWGVEFWEELEALGHDW